MGDIGFQRVATVNPDGDLDAQVSATLILAAAGYFAFSPQSRAADPDPFYGVISQQLMDDGDFDKMEWGRLGSFRMPIDWGVIQREQGGQMNWAWIDAMVAATAERNIDFLPTMYNSPKWVALDHRRMPIWNPDVIAKWRAFLQSAVSRYGADGSFWVSNPDVPYRPVLKWQIWNEPNIGNFAFPVSPRRYARLVMISANVIRNVDPDAKIVAGGLYAKPPRDTGIEASVFLDRLYRTRGFRSSFDIAAIHPYATTTGLSIQRTFPVRRSLNRHKDRSKHIMITELGWGSDSATAFGMDDPEGQGIQLRSAYSKFLEYRRKLKLDAIYWFSWSDLPAGSVTCSFCLETGLFDSDGEAKPAWFRLLDFTHDI
ncbi:MAG: hypothetical protein ACSLFI_14110 [Solirubrobacterales bacterium]